MTCPGQHDANCTHPPSATHPSVGEHEKGWILKRRFSPLESTARRLSAPLHMHAVPRVPDFACRNPDFACAPLPRAGGRFLGVEQKYAKTSVLARAHYLVGPQVRGTGMTPRGTHGGFLPVRAFAARGRGLKGTHGQKAAVQGFLGFGRLFHQEFRPKKRTAVFCPCVPLSPGPWASKARTSKKPPCVPRWRPRGSSPGPGHQRHAQAKTGAAKGLRT